MTFTPTPNQAIRLPYSRTLAVWRRFATGLVFRTRNLQLQKQAPQGRYKHVTYHGPKTELLFAWVYGTLSMGVAWGRKREFYEVLEKPGVNRVYTPTHYGTEEHKSFVKELPLGDPILRLRDRVGKWMT